MKQEYILVDCTRKMIVKRGLAKECRARMETMFFLAKNSEKQAEWGTKDYATISGKSYKVARSTEEKYRNYEDITIVETMFAKEGF